MWEQFDKRCGAVGRPEGDETFLMANMENSVVGILGQRSRRAQLGVELVKGLTG